jgi:hypothetical protein
MVSDSGFPWPERLPESVWFLHIGRAAGTVVTVTEEAASLPFLA